MGLAVQHRLSVCLLLPLGSLLRTALRHPLGWLGLGSLHAFSLLQTLAQRLHDVDDVGHFLGWWGDDLLALDFGVGQFLQLLGVAVAVAGQVGFLFRAASMS